MCQNVVKIINNKLNYIRTKNKIIKNNKMKNQNLIDKKINSESKEMKQKIDTISNVLKSIKQNPKFIKLLIYSMNSLENFVSPPNREIRVNARVIIKCKLNSQFIKFFRRRYRKFKGNSTDKYHKRRSR